MSLLISLFATFQLVFGQMYFIPYYDTEIEYKYLLSADDKNCPGLEINDCIYSKKKELASLFYYLSQDKDYCEIHNGVYKPYGSYITIFNNLYTKSDCIYKDFYSHIKIEYKGKVPVRFYLD